MQENWGLGAMAEGRLQTSTQGYEGLQVAASAKGSNKNHSYAVLPGERAALSFVRPAA